MSNNIITSLFWERKGWARSIPLEYEKIEDSKNYKEIKKISKISKKLKNEGKLKGNETIKQETQIIEDNMNMEEDNNNNDNDDIQLPVFCEDVKKYYTEKEDEEMNNEDSKFPDHFDEISEDEVDDFTIHKTDSIIVCGTAQEDFSNLEVYIYDEENLNLYVHHDIVLSSYPLCIEWLPLKNNVKCNYALVGSFTPGIEIWNLDILDVLEPEVVLGKMNSKNNNNITNSNLYHTDAVMCLNLNINNPNFVASSGADGKILIWDLNSNPNEAKVCYNEHKDKVQYVKWNKKEDNLLISASYDKTIKIFDTRSNKSVFNYTINNDLECLDWSQLDNYSLLFSFENGRIQLFDLKMFNPLAQFQGHNKEATSVNFSPKIKSLFTSVGRDGKVKLWDSNKIINDNNGDTIPTLILDKYIKKSTGELFSCKFADDCENTLAIGGSKGELYIWQLEESPIFCSQYNIKYEDDFEISDKYNNLNNKKKIANKKNKKKK